MTDKITCPTCRGAKVMLKLGGMTGDCNLCSGSGKIKACDLPKPAIHVQEIPFCEVVKQVAQSLPHTETKPVTVEAVPVQKPQPIEETLKVDRRKAIYKHKRA